MSDAGTGVGGSNPPAAIKGGRPTLEHDFYTQWARENAKEFAKTANASLGQFLTLSTALLGGSIAFWANIPIATPYKTLVVVSLLVTVLICVFSVLPLQGVMDPNNPDDIRAHMEYVGSYKLRRLRMARNTIITSIVISIFGLLVTGTALDAMIRKLLA